MYLRAAKADAEEAGIETDGMANSVSELRETIKTLTHDKVDIMSDEAGTKFKSTTQIMREIAGVYDSLSDIDQAALLKTISGKRLANTTSALIQNWSTVEDVIESTKNATGSADAENAKYLDSIQGKLAQFQAQFQSASTSVLDSGLVKGTIDAGSGILGFFNTLIDKLGVLPGLIAPVTSLLLSMNGKGIIGGRGESGENIFGGSGLFSWLKNYNTKNHNYWQEQNDILKSYAQMKQKLSGADFEKALSGATIQSREFAKSLDTVGNEYDVVSGQIDNFTAKQEKIGTLGAKIASTFKGIGSAIASMAVSMLAMVVIQGIIKGVSDALDKAIMSAEEASEITQTVLSNYSSASKEIESNISSVEQMKDRFTELSKGVTDSGKNISLSTEEYQEYQDMVTQLVAINPALIQGYNDEQQAILNKNEAIQQTIDLLKKQRVQEANDAVYGGSSTNDGNKQNYEAAYIDMQKQANEARQQQKEAGDDVAAYLKRVYSNATESGGEAVSKLQKVLESAAGQTYEEYLAQIKKEGNRSNDAPTLQGFIQKNRDAFAPNINDIVGQLGQADLLTKDLLADSTAVINTWNAANSAFDSAGSSMKQMLQMALQANEEYYELSNAQQSFLTNYVSGLSTNTLLQAEDPNVAISYANAMMKVVQETVAGKKAAEDYYDLIEKRDSMPFDQFQNKANQLLDIIHTQLGNYMSEDELSKINLSEVFGITQFETDLKQMRETIRSNFAALSGLTDTDGQFAVVDDQKLSAFKELYDHYIDVQKQLKDNNITAADVNNAVVGNLNFKNRDSIVWNKNNLNLYKSELQSLMKDARDNWDSFVSDMDGQTSTALGMWGNFGENGIPIAFTPLMQTDKGLKPLSDSTLGEYLNALVNNASTMEGDLGENILKLDTQGLKIDGQEISNIVAAIGDDAERTAENMHFLGPNGEVAVTAQEIQMACEAAGVSTAEFFAAFDSGSKEAQEALAGVQKDLSGLMDYDLEKLSKNQLSALNSALTETGSHAYDIAARLSAIAEAGYLPEALDGITAALNRQKEAAGSVSGALADYQKELEGVTDTASEHESMVEIYDDLKEKVNKGRINNDTARAQMKLLAGRTMDLDEAKKWMKENEGFFLTGKDDDKVGQDLTGVLNTLEYKYNHLGEAQKKVVDGLMEADWDTGSIRVAEGDVEALAKAFDMSAASLQSGFDVVTDYSDYVPQTVSTISSAIKELNDDIYTVKSSMSDTERASTQAWGKMSVGARQALETLTKGQNLDLKSMSVQQVDDLLGAFNKLKSNIIGTDTPTFDGLKSSLEGVKTSAGDAAASVSQLEDGTWSIDITSVETFAQKLGVTNEQAQIVLSSLSQIQDSSGKPIKLTIEGNEVETEQKANVIDQALAGIEKERKINVKSSEAMQKLQAIVDKQAEIKSKTVTHTINEVTRRSIVYAGSTTTGTTTGGNYKPGQNGYTNGPAYTGQVGKMTAYASGGNTKGGKTLVGELGPELWIARDGKSQKVVGKHGMEVIDTHAGDAIVPANITASLIRGGMKTAWNGTSGKNARKNLSDATSGKFYDYKVGGSSKKANTTVKVSADTSQLSDSAKEALDKIKEEVEDIIDQIEHKIYLVEKQRGDPMKIVAYYKQIQDEAKKAADRFRAQGQKDSSEYVRSQQKTWWEAHDSIIDTMKDMYDKITSEHENAIKLAERSLDRLLDTDKLERSFTRAQRKIFNSAKLSQNILNGVAKKGNPLAGIFSGIADSFETKTVDTIFSSIDGDAIESTLNGIIDHYREAQKNLHKEAQYYRGMGYSDLSDEVADLSDQWWEYEDAVKDVKQKVIDYLSDIVDAASDSVDTVQDVLDTFKKAAEEYSTNGGFISVDTFQEISKLGVEYMGYLKDENGLLTINEEMINRVIKAKTDQMALESASAYVERLRLALQENDVVSLNNLLNATADLTEVQWGSIYAQLAMLDLTEEGYAQAVKNVDAYRSVLANVKAGVGIDFDDTKDSVDALFKYVEDMIRDEIDQQVDALEELKDKYSEIIDKKKESLQLSKDEADYQDEVADKVKEMAKLQEKINALSLDDSRESIAKRKDLEEQLADLQKELGETQANEAYDRQTDNLDKMQEAYEKEKDAEIKKLQDSISSEEKLYQMARKRIQDGWESLYSDLMKWNTEYGSDLNSQLQSAWDNATKAMEKYKLSYLELYDKLGDSGSNSSSSGSNSTTLGDSNKYGAGSQTEAITGIVQQMYDNSQAWHKASPDEKNNLKKANSKLADKLKGNPYNLDISYDPHTGVWSFSDGTSLYKKYLGKLHTGGVVGDFSTLRQDEMIATLQKGEIVLDKPKQQSLDSILKVMSAITSGLSASALPDLSKTAQMPVSGVNREVVTIPRENVTNVTFGDTIIKGAAGDTVKQHEAVSRRMVNDIIEVLKIKK